MMLWINTSSVGRKIPVVGFEKSCALRGLSRHLWNRWITPEHRVQLKLSEALDKEQYYFTCITYHLEMKHGKE
jgi:hypothetical protein